MMKASYFNTTFSLLFRFNDEKFVEIRIASMHSNKCSSMAGWCAGRGRLSRRRGQAKQSHRYRASHRVCVRFAPDEFAANTAENEGHGVCGCMEAPHARRLRGTFWTGSLQLGCSTRASELRSMPQPQAEDRAERPQTVLQVPQLSLWKVSTYCRQTASDGFADGFETCSGAGWSAPAFSSHRITAARYRVGSTWSATSKGASESRDTTSRTTFVGLAELRLCPWISRCFSVCSPAAVCTASASNAAAAATATTRLVFVVILWNCRIALIKTGCLLQKRLLVHL